MSETGNAAFGSQQVAKGAAMTVVFFTVVLAITLLQRFFIRHEKAIE